MNALQTVRNVYGTVLKNGYYIDYNVDICRVENVGFSPDYWIKSGFGDVDEAALRSFVKENCIAFLVENVDWTYMNDISVDGAYIAYKTGFSSRRDGGGSCNGEMYNFRFEKLRIRLLRRICKRHRAYVYKRYRYCEGSGMHGRYIYNECYL